jgi:terminal uridylyltransferase
MPRRRRLSQERKHTKSLTIDVNTPLNQEQQEQPQLAEATTATSTQIHDNLNKKSTNNKSSSSSESTTSSSNHSTTKTTTTIEKRRRNVTTSETTSNNVSSKSDTAKKAISINHIPNEVNNGRNKSVTVSVLQNQEFNNNPGYSTVSYTRDQNQNQNYNIRSGYSSNNTKVQKNQQQETQQRQRNDTIASDYQFKNIIELERNFIFKMKNPSRQNDQAKYRCTVCNYFCNTIDIAKKHINGVIHKSNLETIKLEMKIRELEMPTNAKLEQLTHFLVDFYLKNVISQNQIKKIYDIYYKFKQKFLSKHPDAIVNIYGSIAYGICFNESSCDISVEFQNSCKTAITKTNAQTIQNVTDLLKTEMYDTFRFNSTVLPLKKAQKQSQSCLNKFTCETIDSTLKQCFFNFTSGIHPQAHKTATLLKGYFELDERAKILAFCLRYIAKLAQIDKVDLCTLPPHSYAIMSIYFLQQLNPPCLPILHEIINSKKLNHAKNELTLPLTTTSTRKQRKAQNDSDEPDYDHDTIDNFGFFKRNLQDYINEKTWQSSNRDNLAALWLKLLTFYSIDFGFKKTFISVRKQKRISKSKVKMYTKKMAIEDPFSLKASLSRNLLTQTNKHIINVFSKSCFSFVLNTHSCCCPQESVDSSSLVETKATNYKALVEPKYKIVDKLIAETGILDAKRNNCDVDEDYNDDFDLVLDIIENGATEEDDLFYFNNKTAKISKNNHLKKSDSTSVGKLVKEIDSLLLKSSSVENQEDDDENELEEDIESEECIESDFRSSTSGDTDDDEDDEIFLPAVSKSITTASTAAESEGGVESVVKSCLNYIVKRVVELNELYYEKIPNTVLTMWQKSGSTSSNFRFTANNLGFAKSPPLICSMCNKDGHLQSECPQDRLPKLEDLPLITDTWKEVLDKICLCIMDDNIQSKREETDRNILFKQIKATVLQKFPEAKLSLFGSSSNGFAMKNSDLDICMTLENCSDKDKSELNFKKIIRTLGSLFRREQSEFDQIEERVSAKVPIVKFRHRKTMIEGDISLYNTLALQNTHLLRTYAECDPRTRVLGHTVKYFAKICRIGDASCGSLSSYAYIVMMIHYLMVGASPPVLPCLQTLNKEKLPYSETNVTIDGWDCWFNRDTSGFKHENRQSVGELWLGFLRYYTETFDWENNVVCIRLGSSDCLTRKIKSWTKHRLAIEDPFELTHNLAAGVSPKMGLYILKSFSKARYLFGHVIGDFRPAEIRMNMEYFFNLKSLVDGSPPMDRNCFSCFKIGHQTKDCPLTNKNKQQKERNNQRQMYDQQEDTYETKECYRCKNFGHRSRDCPQNLKQAPQQQQRIVDANLTSVFRCFKCNQTGHVLRDCPQYQAQKYQQPQQYQQYQQQPIGKINQQSAPAPKIITIFNPTTIINPPIVLKQGDNVQLLVQSNNSNLLSSGSTTTTTTITTTSESTSSSSSPALSSSANETTTTGANSPSSSTSKNDGVNSNVLNSNQNKQLYQNYQQMQMIMQKEHKQNALLSKNPTNNNNNNNNVK